MSVSQVIDYSTHTGLGEWTCWIMCLETLDVQLPVCLDLQRKQFHWCPTLLMYECVLPFGWWQLSVWWSQDNGRCVLSFFGSLSLAWVITAHPRSNHCNQGWRTGGHPGVPREKPGDRLGMNGKQAPCFLVQGVAHWCMSQPNSIVANVLGLHW